MSTEDNSEIIPPLAETADKGEPILKARNLSVHYPIYGGIIKRVIGSVKAVNGIDFDVYPEQTLGIVGESGCGKTTIAKAILNLVKTTSGEIYFKDQRIDNRLKKNKKLRQKIQMVFQEPDASLNPRMKVVDIIGEPLKNLLGIRDKVQIRKRALALLEQVSLKSEHLDRYPHEFSGGQKQRIIIARALACNPEIIVLDEPTSALDVSVQAQILNLLITLQKKFKLAFIFITHDLSVIHHIGHKISVMYLGKIVESGDIEEIFYTPEHPYTKALLSARPAVNEEEKQFKIVLKGEIPNPSNPPSGCPFHPRCTEEILDECVQLYPNEVQVSDTHRSFCWVTEKKYRNEN